MAMTTLSTVMKISKNIEGPIRPIEVIRRLTERTVQLLLIKESAK